MIVCLWLWLGVCHCVFVIECLWLRVCGRVFAVGLVERCMLYML